MDTLFSRLPYFYLKDGEVYLEEDLTPKLNWSAVLLKNDSS